jgi:MOSC domain-containing protein YiiM
MRVVSVNVGRPREFLLKGRTYTSSIWKEPVAGRLAVRGVNIDGDEQADLKVHGGHDKAIYAYAAEDYEWWSGQVGRDLGPGTFGENLTTSGTNLRDARVGERWRVGTTVVEVAQPRLPCFKLGVRMEDPTFPKRFAGAERWGTYLRIVEEGEVGAGDEIDVLSRPDHDVTVALIGAVYYRDRARAAELLSAPELPAGWRTWVQEKASRESAAEV